jgi:hypothetical protein
MVAEFRWLTKQGDNMTNNRHDYAGIIEAVFLDQLKFDWVRLVDDEREDWDAETALESYDYDGRFHEMVDGLVPSYTTDVVELWLDLGMPDGNEMYGHDVSELDIIQQMKVGIYCWTEDYARRHFVTYHEVVTATVTTK